MYCQLIQQYTPAAHAVVTKSSCQHQLKSLKTFLVTAVVLYAQTQS